MRLLKDIIRTLAVLLVCFCLVLSLNACGKTEDGNKASRDNTGKSMENVTEQSEGDASGTEDAGITAGEELTEDKTIDETETAQGPAEPEEEEYSSVLVIYFSHTGTTKGVSEYLYGLVGGDLIEIEPVDPYPAGYSDALEPAKKEQRENARPKIANEIGHFDSYEVIYLGYPIWWGTTPMIVNTLLESYDFSGKTVVPYATSGGTGIEKSIQDIRNEIPDADVKDGLLVRDNDDIIPWLRELGLYE